MRVEKLRVSEGVLAGIARDFDDGQETEGF
jgi:hypothetical protein